MKTSRFASTYSVNHKCLKKWQIKWHHFARKGKIQWEYGKPGTKGPSVTFKQSTNLSLVNFSSKLWTHHNWIKTSYSVISGKLRTAFAPPPPPPPKVLPITESCFAELEVKSFTMGNMTFWVKCGLIFNYFFGIENDTPSSPVGVFPHIVGPKDAYRGLKIFHTDKRTESEF